MKLNLCIVDIPRKNSNGGTLSFRDTKFYDETSDNIQIIKLKKVVIYLTSFLHY